MSPQRRANLGRTRSPDFLYVGKIARAKGIFDPARSSPTHSGPRRRPFRLDVVGEWAGCCHPQPRSSRWSSARASAISSYSTAASSAMRNGRRYAQAHLLLHPTYWDGQPVTILEVARLRDACRRHDGSARSPTRSARAARAT